MRFAMMLVLGSAVGLAGAQTQETGNVPETAAPAAQLKAPAATSNTVKASVPATGVNIPAGTNDKIIIPPGTYVQGKISQVKRGGHVKGRAELLIHFTSMIYPSGYTVLLPGSLENVPGAEKSTVKDSEGTIQQDSQTGEKLGTVAKTAGAGAAIGGIAGQGWKGAGIGAGVGGAVGGAIAMLSRGADVRLEPGTSVEMVIQREVPLDTSRIHLASK
jgi:hypothetical protein